jgi:hypothetical protein
MNSTHERETSSQAGAMNSLIPTYCTIGSSGESNIKGETNRPPSVILSEAKDLTRWATRSFASLRMTSRYSPFQPRFWPPILGLLNEYVGVNGNELRPYILHRVSP